MEIATIWIADQLSAVDTYQVFVNKVGENIYTGQKLRIINVVFIFDDSMSIIVKVDIDRKQVYQVHNE